MAKQQTAHKDEGAREGGGRVVTNLPVGQVVDGIGFAQLPSDATRYLSAPIADETRITRLCSIPGFWRAEGIADEDVEAVDRRITTVMSTAMLEGATGATGDEVGVLKRTVEELTAANELALAELDKTRGERDAAVNAGSTAENDRLKREVERLRALADVGGGPSIALERENDQLRTANAALTEELEQVRNGLAVQRATAAAADGQEDLDNES